MLNKKQLAILSSKSTIIEVMELMNKLGSTIALIENQNDSLQGIVTDGDIRRSLIQGYDKKDSIVKILNTTPKTVHEEMPFKEVLQLFSEKHKFLPILDDDRRIKGLYNSADFSVMLDIKSRTICVIGMGYVGLTLSLVMADVGYKVYGYDLNVDLIDSLSKGNLSFFEDGIDIYLKKHINEGLIPTSSLDDVDADTFIVSVGTPIDEDTKLPRIDYIEEAIKSIAPYIKQNDLLILRSTVPVGTTRKVVLPILRELINLEPGQDYFLAYAPERTIEGAALNETRELPQVIGGYDEKSSLLTQQLFKELTNTIIEVENLESAEMIKIMNNTFRDVKFAYANEMALICKDLGLDMVSLVHSANMGYVRDKIPVPSPGVGGPCLTKDSYILLHSTKNIKSHPYVVEQSRKINESIPLILSDEILLTLNSLNKRISEVKFFIVGFAFKGEPETSDMRGSTSIDLLKDLFLKGAKNDFIYGYDPIVESKEINSLGIKHSNLEEGFSNADVVIIMNNHHSYKKMDIYSYLKMAKKDLIFVDGWHMFDPKDITKDTSYKYIGVGCK